MILRYSRNSGASISIGIDFWLAFFFGGIRIVSADENVASSWATRLMSS